MAGANRHVRRRGAELRRFRGVSFGCFLGVPKKSAQFFRIHLRRLFRRDAERDDTLDVHFPAAALLALALPLPSEMLIADMFHRHNGYPSIL